ncbi:hypothetical protein HAX54_052522 [Datura stramonium]|uniref:TAFII55 protein conserved region domain-containing protein n=1 Tax=Datura stramonium TaxID=4076 RepID=A0ABS8T0Y4_DATST|nr:hypothetical protein [Datura stramonium]
MEVQDPWAVFSLNRKLNFSFLKSSLLPHLYPKPSLIAGGHINHERWCCSKLAPREILACAKPMVSGAIGIPAFRIHDSTSWLKTISDEEELFEFGFITINRCYFFYFDHHLCFNNNQILYWHYFGAMDEQFILRVPPSVAERIDRLLSENASSEDKLDLSFSEDGKTGTFVIGDEHFPASLLNLPCIVESYKTYDDNVLIKSADIGQMIMVREEGDPAPDVMEYRHGLTPPMRDARRRRFRREPDLNPELVRRVEKDLQNIMAGGTAENIDILLYLVSPLVIKRTTHEVAEPEEGGEASARHVNKKVVEPTTKPDISEPGTAGEDPDRTESEDSDDSI